MDVKAALEFADRAIYNQTGKHLNDLEREVFVGSWEGQTYEEIYPLNPQYVEKYVGYRLWQKLSQALGTKVTKKRLKGALARASRKRVPIGYCNQEPDSTLAVQLFRAIEAAGHQPFLGNIGATSTHPTDWLSQLNTELKQCNTFLLLLSPQTAVSEMAIEVLRQIQELRDIHHSPPIVLSVRIDCPHPIPLNHDLRNYLLGTLYREWRTPEDTDAIARDVIQFLATEDRETLNTWQKWETEERENREAAAKSQLEPPLPVAEPELPKGQVRLASAFYIERIPLEARCYQSIVQPGALIRLKAPRQMGKTSLMARILYHAKEQGYRTVPLSFQHADKSVFANLNHLLRWFCARIARKLRSPYKVEDRWTDTYGSKDNCTAFFEDCLLPEDDRPLVLGLDEVDRVFQYANIADDFFGLLRAWYEEASYGYGDSELWEKLRLVVVHSTEVYKTLDINQSPFNVGLPIELSEFSPEQVAEITRRHGLHWDSEQVQQLMTVVGGHPYLVRLALYHIAQDRLNLTQLLDLAPTEAGIYGDHLRRHLWSFQQHPELAAAFRQVITEPEPIELESVLAFKLHSMGLVHLRGDRVMPRFELYRQYFRDRLASI
ncbi:AAA-like domain-containing protein [Lusitaniella coriacea]|uniref:AAA-like domain-containing protein n=1 Tax=Lusitaniella coriacea TaxID=1983105 RepID=UPI003CF14245